MRILADKDISYVHELFGLDNQIITCDGRHVSSKHLKNIDMLIIRSVTKINYKLLYNNSIKFIGTTTSGIDHIDQNAIKKNNIKFTFAPGSNAISVVEYVLASLFWIAQCNHFFLRDKTVGIIGVGNIGNLLYQRLHSFGVHTLLYDPYISKINNHKNWKSFDSLVAESHILTFHTPLTYTGSYPTWHMVNKDVLEALPNNCILINTARGAVIDNIALLQALKCGKKINVILDVWEFEPYLLSSLLNYIDIGTPHIAGYTFESKIRSIMSVYQEFCNYFNILKNIDLSYLLSMNTCCLRLKSLDEVFINKLIQAIYHIYTDYLLLKNCSIHLGEFDLLRRFYYNRREWSSLCISTGKDYFDEILMNLGFGIL